MEGTKKALLGEEITWVGEEGGGIRNADLFVCPGLFLWTVH